MKSFQQIGTDVGELVETKNQAYGSSFATAGAAMRLLYPNGVRPDQVDDALMIVRIWDKLMRIATDRDALGESPYQDVAGYGILGVHMHQQKKEGQAGPCSDIVPTAESVSAPKDDSSTASRVAGNSTTTIVSATNAPPSTGPSTRPCSHSSEPKDANAPTATERASAVADDRVRNALELNRRNECGHCGVRLEHNLVNFSDVFPLGGDLVSICFGNKLCALSFRELWHKGYEEPDNA